jgi:hypothetical protein
MGADAKVTQRVVLDDCLSLVISVCAVIQARPPEMTAQPHLLESEDHSADRLDGMRRRGSGNADHGFDWWNFCFVDCSAFDCRHSERLHSDSCTSPLRPGSGSAISRQLRRSPPPVPDARPRHPVGGIWTAILVLTGSYETLYSYSILAAWIFHTLRVGAVFVLRRELPNAARPYKMWAYPATLVLLVAISIWFVMNAFMTHPGPSLHGLCYRCHWSPGLLDLAQTGAFRLVPQQGSRGEDSSTRGA